MELKDEGPVVGKILLLSNGFEHGAAKNAFEGAFEALAKGKPNPRIAVIPSGIPLKQQGEHIHRLMQNLSRLTTDLSILDLHKESIESLKSADVCVITGGNPYTLLTLIRKRGHAILSKILDRDGLLVASSGGAMILGSDVAITGIINPSIKRPGNFDLKGLGLFEENVFPHFNRYTDGQYEDRRDLIEDWLIEHKHFAIADDQYVLLDWKAHPKPFGA
ncbi:MAG: hypothetical protein EOP07_00885 [Proteobacteria bacterium]|nr:MAG: hypothetical protein EOP07_00885 [Pseudomonadota bacterium]